MKALALFFSICASACFAQDYDTRSSDVRLDDVALSQMILGRDLAYFDGGVSRYSVGGGYSWTYSPENGGGIWEGQHVIQADGVICIEFPTLRSRCDLFVQSGERLVLLSEDGQRFPVREIR